MNTATAASTTGQRADACATHGVVHRPGSKAAATCPDTTDTTTAAAPLEQPVPAPVTVTPAQLRAVLATYGGRLARLVLPTGEHLLIAGGLSFGETIVDRADVLVLLDHLGSLAAVAEDLTIALRWEQDAALAGVA